MGYLAQLKNVIWPFVLSGLILQNKSALSAKNSPTSEDCGTGSDSTTCSSHNGNPCLCRKTGCEFNVTAQECLQGRRVCEDCEMDIWKSECRRMNGFYVNGGVICRNKKERGNCRIKDILIAVNFGHEGYGDVNGVDYVPYEDVEGHIPDGTSFGSKMPVIFGAGVDTVDEILYSTYVIANPEKPNAKECLSYHANVESDGEFEFSAKFIEFKYTKPGQRSFSIKLNGVTVVQELDIKALVGDDRNILNLCITFNVTDDRRTLILPGYPNTPITNGKVVVQFCNGLCPEVSSLWTLSAFSVIQFGIPSEPIGECRKHDQSVCDCVSHSCELKAATGQCHPGIEICSNYYGAPEDCRREGAFYTDGGLICQNNDAIGDCQQFETSYGVNLNGPSHTSSDNIEYKAEVDVASMTQDPFKIKHQYELNCKNILGVSSEDGENLYKKVTGSVPKKVKSRRCLSYTIPLCEDGRYELLIRTVDQSWAKNRTNRLNVIFGAYSVYNEIDLFELAGQQCKPVELAILFEVDNQSKLLRIQGFPNSDLKDGPQTTLGLCYSECTELGDNFQASAFSMVRLGDPLGGIKDTCGENNGNSCECIRSQCNYQPGKQLCTKRKIACSACDNEQMMMNPTECRRAGAFYLDGTGICKNAFRTGNCSFGEVVKAVNLNGPAVTSSIGVDYESFQSAKPERGPAHLKTEMDELDNNTIPPEDKVLYGTFVHSDDTDAPCMAYDIPIKDDGSYELALKTWDNSNTETGKRTMRIMLNQLNIVEDLDVVLVAGHRQPADIIVNFNVSGGITRFSVNGHRTSNIRDRKIPFEICHGRCRPNIGWLLGAFSVVRFEQKGGPINPGTNETVEISDEEGCGTSEKGTDSTPLACASFSENICDCKKHGCEYNIENKCYPGLKLCKECEAKPSKVKCRRAHSFYFDAGVACKNIEERGKCKFTEVLIAVTFGGNEITDSKGTIYQSFHISKPDFLPEGARVGNSTGILTDPKISPEDRKLFESFMVGDALKPNTKECLRYSFKVDSDGFYELGIKMSDFVNHKSGKRGFNIKFNGVDLVRELDIIKLTGSMKQGLNLVVNFQVNMGQTILALPGFPLLSIDSPGNLSLEFCNGDGGCKKKSKIWIVSSFSVLKFFELTI